MALHKAPRIGQRAKIPSNIKYHIDYGWWGRANRNLRVYLQTHLCLEHQGVFANYTGEEVVDWIDPRTAQVRPVNGLEHTLHTHCSQQSEYITPVTPVMDAVFRVFLSNGNSPLTAQELAGRIGKLADTIELTLAGRRIYKGIRPVHEEDEE